MRPLMPAEMAMVIGGLQLDETSRELAAKGRDVGAIAGGIGGFFYNRCWKGAVIGYLGGLIAGSATGLMLGVAAWQTEDSMA